ncbi:hypothetical protein [Sandaracinus amylolyticus]|uniref:hypothetical protein n=1 Tax=Sandaracinus amylolyticus TaxID=927083 RepID=UPI001F46C8DC|nr:hypothetical protein [Sandaracinus amylolyticus]
MWSWLRGKSASSIAEPPRDVIVPRICNARVVDELVGVLEHERDVVIFEPLVGELVIGYGFDLPGRYQGVALRDLERLRIAKPELRDVATENLLRMLGGGVYCVQAGPLFEVRVGHHLEASTLVVDEFWDHLRDELEADVVVALIDRDHVLACSVESTDTVEALAAIVADEIEQRSGPVLSEDLLLWTGDWELLDDSDA